MPDINTTSHAHHLSTMTASPISATIDFNRPGVHHGHLRLPWSRDESAWGSILIPVSVIHGQNDGPTLLATGGNHGDEYEGPLALLDLALSLSPDTLHGRVIIVPFMNYPAATAARRTSPIDGGNLNRLFPGNPTGSLTEKIADYFTRHLVPLADTVLDFHSGGKSLDFVPFCANHILEDKAQEHRCRAARDAFNAPYSVDMLEIDALGMFDTTVEAMGKTFITTEIGGGGTSTPQSVAIARKGLRNLLIHDGIIKEEPEIASTRLLSQPGPECFSFAESGGVVEFHAALGQTVQRGDVLAQIWDIATTGKPPHIITAGIDGLLIARHHPGLCHLGDCLAVLAVEHD